MQEYDLNRLIEMAWQDRTTFDAIYLQYGLTENQVKNKMRKLISKKAYDRWRKRVQNKATKHKKSFIISQIDFKVHGDYLTKFLYQ